MILYCHTGSMTAMRYCGLRCGGFIVHWYGSVVLWYSSVDSVDSVVGGSCRDVAARKAGDSKPSQ